MSDDLSPAAEAVAFLAEVYASEDGITEVEARLRLGKIKVFVAVAALHLIEAENPRAAINLVNDYRNSL